MLFTLLMRDEFIFYKATESSLQLLLSPCTVCWVGFSRSTVGGSTAASGSDSGAALVASEPQLIPLAGWQILPFQNFVTPLALPVCCIANKISQLLENNLCAAQNVTRSCSIWQSSQHHLERAGDNLYSSTMTAELSFPHPSKDSFCYISRNLVFLSLTAQASEMVPNLTAN